MTSPIRLTIDGDVGRLTLNRPSKRNALSAEMVDRATQAIDELAAAGARIAVVDAEGPVFCSGADLAEVRDDLAAPSFERFVRGLLRTDVFFLAALEGPALGAGIAIAAACPVVLCTGNVWFALPEHAIGLFPSLVLAYAEESVGARRGLRMGLSGERLAADAALQCGLVSEVVAPGELDLAVDRWIGILRRDQRVTRDAARGWRARFDSESFVARRKILGEILAS
jgi:enoyl-CoA hydratase/carnithine racemase